MSGKWKPTNLSDSRSKRWATTGPTTERWRQGLADTVLVLAAPLESIKKTIKTALIILVIAGIITAAALSALIWLVVRRSFRGLDEMVTTAGTIATGDLAARAPLGNERDEVGRLGKAINTMLD